MADHVSGAQVGALLAEVTFLVKETITTTEMFRTPLTNILDLFNSLKPEFDKMGQHYNDRPDEELRPFYNSLRACQDTLKKCKTIRKWQFLDKLKCSKELEELGKQIILHFRNSNMAIIAARKAEKIMASISESKDATEVVGIKASSYEYEFDVFLSFRGEDTRESFTGTLFHSLCKVHKVKTFMDVIFKKGSKLEELLTMIEKSRISIVVFSENFAESEWCLKELTKIFQEKDRRGHEVVPLFYKVNPSELRRQDTGKTKEHMEKHQNKYRKDSDIVKSWSNAIKELGGLSGYVYYSGTGEDISVGDGYYNDMYVTQHDLLRDLAIHYNNQGPLEERERLNLNIRKNNLPEWFLKEQKQPLKARLMSICTDEEFSSSWPDLELPEVEVLVLNFRAKKNNYVLPNFIKKMVKLKTLIITNNGSLLAELSNFDVIASLSNLKKIRLEHVKIPSHTITGLCLSNLKKVSAFQCDISEEIQTSEFQIHTVLPALEEIDISYCNNLKTLPNGICEAKTLKKISITNCHKLSELPEEIGNLSELQVLRLNTCTSLETLPSSIKCLENLSYLDISNCISIQKLPKEIGELHQLKELHLSFCSYLSSLPASVSRLEKLGYLIVDKEQGKFMKSFKNRPKLKLRVAVEDMSLNFFGGIAR